MADVMTKVCDVYGGMKDVKSYRLVLKENVADVSPSVIDPEGVESWIKDLSPRARKRLRRFIERGLRPPTPKADAAPEGENFDD